MSDYRTLPGDVFREPLTGLTHIVVSVYRGEDLHRFVDPTCYQHRPIERTALAGGGRRTKPTPNA